jgi:hypothetical protein
MPRHGIAKREHIFTVQSTHHTADDSSVEGRPTLRRTSRFRADDDEEEVSEEASSRARRLTVHHRA